MGGTGILASEFFTYRRVPSVILVFKRKAEEGKEALDVNSLSLKSCNVAGSNFKCSAIFMHSFPNVAAESISIIERPLSDYL